MAKVPKTISVERNVWDQASERARKSYGRSLSNVIELALRYFIGGTDFNMALGQPLKPEESKQQEGEP